MSRTVWKTRLSNLLADLEQLLIELEAENASDQNMLARLRLLLAHTKLVRKKFAPQWNYLKDPPPRRS